MRDETNQIMTDTVKISVEDSKQSPHRKAPPALSADFKMELLRQAFNLRGQRLQQRDKKIQRLDQQNQTLTHENQQLKIDKQHKEIFFQAQLDKKESETLKAKEAERRLKDDLKKAQANYSKLELEKNYTDRQLDRSTRHAQELKAAQQTTETGTARLVGITEEITKEVLNKFDPNREITLPVLDYKHADPPTKINYVNETLRVLRAEALSPEIKQGDNKNRLNGLSNAIMKRENNGLTDFLDHKAVQKAQHHDKIQKFINSMGVAVSEKSYLSKEVVADIDTIQTEQNAGWEELFRSHGDELLVNLEENTTNPQNDRLRVRFYSLDAKGNKTRMYMPYGIEKILEYSGTVYYEINQLGWRFLRKKPETPYWSAAFSTVNHGITSAALYLVVLLHLMGRAAFSKHLLEEAVQDDHQYSIENSAAQNLLVAMSVLAWAFHSVSEMREFHHPILWARNAFSNNGFWNIFNKIIFPPNLLIQDKVFIFASALFLSAFEGTVAGLGFDKIEKNPTDTYKAFSIVIGMGIAAVTFLIEGSQISANYNRSIVKADKRFIKTLRKDYSPIPKALGYLWLGGTWFVSTLGMTAGLISVLAEIHEVYKKGFEDVLHANEEVANNCAKSLCLMTITINLASLMVIYGNTMRKGAYDTFHWASHASSHQVKEFLTRGWAWLYLLVAGVLLTGNASRFVSVYAGTNEFFHIFDEHMTDNAKHVLGSIFAWLDYKNRKYDLQQPSHQYHNLTWSNVIITRHPVNHEFMVQRGEDKVFVYSDGNDIFCQMHYNQGNASSSRTHVLRFSATKKQKIAQILNPTYRPGDSMPALDADRLQQSEYGQIFLSRIKRAIKKEYPSINRAWTAVGITSGNMLIYAANLAGFMLLMEHVDLTFTALFAPFLAATFPNLITLFKYGSDRTDHDPEPTCEIGESNPVPAQNNNCCSKTIHSVCGLFRVQRNDVREVLYQTLENENKRYEP